MLLKVHISLAILMATQGFAPPDGLGLLSEEVSMIAHLSFIGSIFGSALGITKFILGGPLPLLSKDSPLTLYRPIG